ncbi:MAG: SIR2 family protein [Stellaceae bacterium]
MIEDTTRTALRQFLDQADASIFVGSGLSLWSGLPTWEELIRKLIDVAAAKGATTKISEEALASKQLLDAADALQLTPLEIAGTLWNELGFALAKPHEIHSLVVRLGPQRFITTNYDTLLEQQLGLDGRLGRFRTVTGRQVAELADIMKARSDLFIFKPHGDIADADSLVLASRDYERIIGGHANEVGRTLGTLLVTRPVLFLGYGLRDLDTSLVLRTIRDRYLGNVSDFVAVIADATEEHRNYWWDRFRIRIHSYATGEASPGRRDHSPLLDLLRWLVAARPGIAAPTAPLGRGGRKSPDIRVDARRATPAQDPTALVRYAARLVRPEPALSFPLFGRRDDWRSNRRYSDESKRFRHAPIEQILRSYPGSLIVVGPAGSGKSFAFARFLSDCGRTLLEWQGKPGQNAPPIPVLLDGRLYDGEFSKLAAAAVPDGLDLTALSGTHEILIFVDSLDEMPIEHLNEARWPANLQQFVERFHRVRVVYGTRRSSLVARRDLAVFDIEPLDAGVARSGLEEMGVDSKGFF